MGNYDQNAQRVVNAPHLPPLLRFIRSKAAFPATGKNDEKKILNQGRYPGHGSSLPLYSWLIVVLFRHFEVVIVVNVVVLFPVMMMVDGIWHFDLLWLFEPRRRAALH